MKKIFIIIFFFFLIGIAPVILWGLDKGETLQVAIINKTVADETYREHLGITWVLNHFQYHQSDGSRYQADEDYFGFQVNEKNESFEVKPLLTDYQDYDVIYIADTYGVYEDDLPWIEKEREGARTPLIHGGMEIEEWRSIAERLDNGKPVTLIAEFNTLASPTDPVVRDQMSDYLGIEWSGWMGRYFDELDLDKNLEIPQWVLDEFGDDWNYRGAGFLLVNDTNHEIVVLEQEEHVHSEGIKMEFTDAGREKFNLNTSPNYHYWFDIVIPKKHAQSLATFQWELSKTGEDLLEEHNIPKEFAGIVETSDYHINSYYLAGDFNDVASTPGFYQAKGLSKIYQTVHSFSEEAFYWSAYVPVMKAILQASLELKENETEAVETEEQLSYTSRVSETYFEVYEGGEWKDITIKGVNIGMAKPGVFPGEAAITEEEYARWFEYIGEMGANTIRIYTLHPPGFYKALKEYNESHEEKLYLFHGVWINEEKMVNSLDAFDEDALTDFQAEMQRIVDATHGNATVAAEPGHASGTYATDVSEYVIGWILGVEWYPLMVENTNQVHEEIGEYNGNYVQTEGAAPFEHWLAEQMDYIATYEIDTYHMMRPLSFTNWVTTDLLTHPAEPNAEEDLASVDPNVIQLKEELLDVNQFASYHVYPYYPDFFNFEEEYLQFEDHRGEPNSYAAYLKDLHEAHKIPVLIAEFGVPGSRGLTHENPFGWNQGFLSEKEQGEIIVHLFEDILHEEMLGGLVFTWQDEWFKRTWNTMDYDNPDRRPFWSNAQTNEQQFGLLSFDRHKIKVDGETDDWAESTMLHRGENQLKALHMDVDERYLYLRIDQEDGTNGDIAILLDTAPNQGNTTYEQQPLQNEANFVIEINDEGAHVLIDPYYDYYTYLYGHTLKMLDDYEGKPVKDSGAFIPIFYALNQEIRIPSTDEVIPFSGYETGALKQGISNPKHRDYYSLADYYMKENGVIEIRIPWLLLQFQDPSQREVIGDLYEDGGKEGEASSVKIEDITIAVVKKNGEEWVDTIPERTEDGILPFINYQWETWNEPLYEERLKQSYYLVQEAFQQIP